MKLTMGLLLDVVLSISSASLLAAPGDLAWQDHYDREGSRQDLVRAVDARAGKVFVVGQSTAADEPSVFTVRAYDGDDGTLLWDDYYVSGDHQGDQAYDVKVYGGRVFVAGVTRTIARGPAFTVRAYSPDTGRLLWMDNYDSSRNGIDGAAALSVSPDGEKVFAVGHSETTGHGLAFTVRAYNAADGNLLWDDYYDAEDDGNDEAKAVSSDRMRVYVAGYTHTAASGSAFTVRTYDAADGTLLWEKYYNREGTLQDQANAIRVLGERVFVAGRSQSARNGVAFAVRAYDATDGTRLWSDNYDAQGRLADEANALVASSMGVFAVGYSTTATLGKAFTVRAYNAADGRLLWSNHRHASRSDLDDEASAVAAMSGAIERVFVAGMTSTAAGGEAFTLRAYNPRTGSLLWASAYNREGGLSDWARGVAVSGSNVVAAGWTSTADGGLAFAVRAFQQ